MHPRLRWTLAGAVACAAAAVVAVSLAADDRQQRAPRSEPAGSLRPAIPQSRAVLVDQDGRRTSLAAGRGTVVVAFVYAACRDTCPLQADQIRGALDALGSRAAGVRVALVSVDPANDTPAAAKRFLLDHGLAGRASYLLGPRAALRRVWRDYGIAPQREGREHSSYTVIADRVQRVGFPPDKLTAGGLAHDLALVSGKSDS